MELLARAGRASLIWGIGGGDEATKGCALGAFILGFSAVPSAVNRVQRGGAKARGRSRAESGEVGGATDVVAAPLRGPATPADVCAPRRRRRHGAMSFRS
jgi:hypothetical protein